MVVGTKDNDSTAIRYREGFYVKRLIARQVRSLEHH